MSSRQIAVAMARAALGLKAEEVAVLDLRKLSYAFDFFVLCSCSSDRRMDALSDTLQEVGADQGKRLWHVEGRPEGGWVLLDYGDVVVHLFSPEMREFYMLDRLWADAPRISIQARAAPSANGRAVRRRPSARKQTH